jgi:ABC-type bacteriocin/lantibiotic exporter with double-glycine peptidase domain
MMLAHCGITVAEEELVQQTTLQADGTSFEEVVRLARQYQLSAEIRRLDLEETTRLFNHDSWAIAFVDRGVINGVSGIHAVIPIGVSRWYVTFLDPLRGQRRVARRRFDAAWDNVKHLAIVFEPR